VARGFTEAIDGELQLEDTPGGGTTMAFAFDAAPEQERAETRAVSGDRT
jgi:hypothetical protein